MKYFIFAAVFAFTACGPTTSNQEKTADSVAKRPNAPREDQIPGTPGPAGTDSTRPGNAAHNTPSDSAR